MSNKYLIIPAKMSLYTFPAIGLFASAKGSIVIYLSLIPVDKYHGSLPAYW